MRSRNRYREFFRHTAGESTVAVHGGTFFLRAEENGDGQLWFVNASTNEETLLIENVREMHPFFEDGVACLMRMPQGDKRAWLFFFEGQTLQNTIAYFAEDGYVYYEQGGELRKRSYWGADTVVMDVRTLAEYGVVSPIQFNEAGFCLITEKETRRVWLYFHYDGTLYNKMKF